MRVSSGYPKNTLTLHLSWKSCIMYVYIYSIYNSRTYTNIEKTETWNGNSTINSILLRMIGTHQLGESSVKSVDEYV